jgi:hypothetical protein
LCEGRVRKEERMAYGLWREERAYLVKRIS